MKKLRSRAWAAIPLLFIMGITFFREFRLSLPKPPTYSDGQFENAFKLALNQDGVVHIESRELSIDELKSYLQTRGTELDKKLAILTISPHSIVRDVTAVRAILTDEGFRRIDLAFETQDAVESP